MPFKLGTAELVILFAIALLLFGVGRIGKIGAEIGQGIRELRRGLSAPEEESKTEPATDKDAEDELKPEAT